MKVFSLLLLALLALSPLRVEAAFAYISGTSAASTTGTGVTTSGINTTGANLIVVTTGEYAPAGLSTLSDSKGNTWTALSSYSSGVNETTLYYCYSPTVGTGHTFTISGLTNYPGIAVMAFSGATSSPLDQQNGAAGAGASLQTGSVSPGSNNELIVTGLSFNGNTTVSIDSGFSSPVQTPLVANEGFGVAISYLIQTSRSAVNPTWSLVTGTNVAAGIATFKSPPVISPKGLMLSIFP